MPSNSVASRYSSLSIFLHWLMLALMIAVYATMELKSYPDKGSDLRAALVVWHYTAGVLILYWYGCASWRVSKSHCASITMPHRRGSAHSPGQHISCYMC